jgi:NDP-mannose synthase
MRAVVLAGGKGTRLLPYTTLVPKPLVPIGGKYSILEIVLMQLKSAGFTHVTLAVNHLANLIVAYFGDGSRWDLKLDYSIEDRPLSTIAPLTLIDDLPENFLVMNGDILCNLDYKAFYERHVAEGCDITVAACKRSVTIDFGVLGYDDASKHLQTFAEKPQYHFDVSMGVYCLRRRVLDDLAKGEAYGFDHLMIDGIKNGRVIRIHPFSGFWLDIGRPEDYQTANERFASLSKELGVPE